MAKTITSFRTLAMAHTAGAMEHTCRRLAAHMLSTGRIHRRQLTAWKAVVTQHLLPRCARAKSIHARHVFLSRLTPFQKNHPRVTL